MEATYTDRVKLWFKPKKRARSPPKKYPYYYVHIPIEVVRKLGLSKGDEVEVIVKKKGS